MKLGLFSVTLRYLVLTACTLLLGGVESPSFADGTTDGIKIVGVTKPAHDVKLGFPIDGVIAEIYVSEGDRVEKGQPLARLDDELQKLETEKRKVIWQDRSKLISEEHKLKIINSLLTSARKLYRDSGAVSAEEVKKLEIQQANVSGSLDTLKSNKKKEQLEYEIARAILDKHVLKSPIDGVVTEVHVDRGEWIRTGTTAIRVVDRSKVFLEMNVEESLARRLRVGSQLDIHSGEMVLKSKGKVVYVSPVADRASSLVRVKVVFENNGEMIPGKTAFVLIPSE
ncbi:efflux RND transporter periplasmic adaptor subunit [Candidatus Parcubacteria bacterium]|nr:MAG: efflux RND transporter periplasmic adaptor subunit [Candidatus Parcubacteria bacterium]